METVYLVVVLFLAVLAISDLVVGVANDAVNFLNSAIGSRIAPLKVILTVTSLGVLLGATFSSGMMEVARSGVFHPEMFYFQDVMVLFVAVMMADVLLLDLFNTFGLPTSTTVSLVFDLLGAAVAVSLYKIQQAGGSVTELSQYINTDKALAIISGILISVVIAFVVGLVVQYIARFLFTFNHEKTYRLYGALFGGLAITSIVYFMIMKGAKGASFMKPEYLAYLEEHAKSLLIANLVGWTLFLQLLMFFRINIFKIVILAGTFALAFAFAGNDLVNFIGVPLAGLSSFETWRAGSEAADSLLMGSLHDPVQSATIYLLLAGTIMAATLWFSKKAHRVIQTSLKLSSQSENEGKQQFESTALSRAIVRATIHIGQTFSPLIPDSVSDYVSGRFAKKRAQETPSDDTPVTFDQIRASVNLVTASILIASATSLKLPLSTTYVTFMVAMGTSLADGAWDRESAVYRVSGVVTVIGGWFLTALTAFLFAFVIAWVISATGLWMMALLGVLVLFFLFSDVLFGKSKVEEIESDSKGGIASVDPGSITNAGLFQVCSESSLSLLLNASKISYLTVLGLIGEKRKKLKQLRDDAVKLSDYTKEQRSAVYNSILKQSAVSVESSRNYVLVLDSMREISNCILFSVRPVFEHVDNNHSPLLEPQAADLSQFNEELASFFNEAVHIVKNQRYGQLADLSAQKDNLLENLEKMQKRQLKLIKQRDVSTRTSMLYLNLLSEYKTMILLIMSMVKTLQSFSQLAVARMAVSASAKQLF